MQINPPPGHLFWPEVESRLRGSGPSSSGLFGGRW